MFLKGFLIGFVIGAVLKVIIRSINIYKLNRLPKQVISDSNYLESADRIASFLKKRKSIASSIVITPPYMPFWERHNIDLLRDKRSFWDDFDKEYTSTNLGHCWLSCLVRVADICSCKVIVMEK